MQLPLFLVSVWAAAGAGAQVTFGTETITACRPGSTQLEVGFPSCNEWLDVMAECATYEDWPSYQECLCTQDLFSNIVFCQSEFEQCFGEEDTSINDSVDLWHLNCDNYTVTPTTPVPTAEATTYPNDFCGKTVADECASAKDLNSECGTNFVTTPTATAALSTLLEELSSCMCRDDLILAQYTCLYLANVSCHATAGVVSSLPLYDICTNIDEVVEAAGGVITPEPTLPDNFESTSTPTSTTTTTDSGAYSWRGTWLVPLQVLVLAVGLAVFA